ncbi:MAG: Gfo/Idh/MocA family oxidoreductase, partial [Anaerolineae bacterium]|nr:Gfo/Idh/MocA family oxidoreductase [Anaerolineae bacterium]
MADTYRVGVIGFAHMHVNTLIDEFDKLPNVTWVACSDTKPARLPLSAKPSSRLANVKRAREITGLPKVYDDYREMLDNEKFDIIIFCPENARHGEVGEAIADHGIHMVTEKPMSASLADALRLVRAVRRNDVELMVNWPTTWSPAIRKMKEVVDSGVIGDVWEFKWRNGASMGPLAYTTGEDAFSDAEKGAEW